MQWVIRVAPSLVVFWLVLSGHFEPLFFALGAVSVAVVCWITLRTEAGRDPTESHPRLAPRLPLYLLWLAKEILLAAVAVARQVWSRRPDLHPVVAETSTPDTPTVSEVIYANSITLTPGTLSLRVDDEGIEVHSLDPDGIADLDTGRMLRRVRQLEAGS